MKRKFFSPLCLFPLSFLLSDHEFVEQQETYLLAVSQRTMALPVGRLAHFIITTITITTITILTNTIIIINHYHHHMHTQ